MGEPNRGKTSLSQELVCGARRIHLDNVCLILAIKHPELLPPEIPSDALPDIDISVNLTGKIHAFCAWLARLGKLSELVATYMDVYQSRDKVQVVEGYALGAVLKEMETAHRAMGRDVTKVWCEENSLIIDGETFSFPQGKTILKRYLQPLKYG